MNQHLRSLIESIRQVAKAAESDQVTFLAASIAFYAMLSVFPLLLLALVIGGLVGGEGFATAIVDAVKGLLTEEAEEILADALVSGAGRSGAGVLGFVFLIWSGLRVFRGLDIAFAMIYGTPDQPSFLNTIVQAVAVLIALIAGFAVIFLVRISLYLLGVPPIWRHLSILPLIIALSLLFVPMYYVFPRHKHTLSEIIPGVLFAATGWIVLSEVFAIYAANAGTFVLFGVIGGVLLLMMWFYFAAILILLGAIINAILSGQHALIASDYPDLPSNADAESTKVEE